MRTQQNISIRIADTAPIQLTIAPETEEWIREAERSVNIVWERWRRDYASKSSKEILAMVAFQFAKLFCQLQHRLDENRDAIADFEKELDRLLAISDGESTD